MPDNINNMFYGAPAIIQRQAAQLRKRMTLPEQKLWESLSVGKLGVKFRRQHPINQFIADFYCHEVRLVIEVDGEIHLKKEAREYDAMRTEVLESYGIKVIRFSNERVLETTNDVLGEIRLVIEALKKEPGD